MTEKTILIPGPDHPITVERSASRVVVSFGGVVVADTKNALILRQPSSPTRFCIPRQDVNMALMSRSERTSYCPYKGDVSYYNLEAGGKSSANAAFSYEHPHDAVAEIKEHLGFYTEKVDSIVENPAE